MMGKKLSGYKYYIVAVSSFQSQFSVKIPIVEIPNSKTVAVAVSVFSRSEELEELECD